MQRPSVDMLKDGLPSRKEDASPSSEASPSPTHMVHDPSVKKKVWRVQASCVDYLYAQSPIYVHTCLSRDDIHVDVDAPKTTLVYACICAFLIYFYMHACKLDMNSCFHIYPKNIHYPNIILTCPVGRLTTPPRVHVVNGSMFCGS